MCECEKEEDSNSGGHKKGLRVKDSCEFLEQVQDIWCLKHFWNLRL